MIYFDQPFPGGKFSQEKKKKKTGRVIENNMKR